MPVVTETIHAPGGAVQAGILIEIVPSGDGFYSSDGHWITGCTRVRTDDNGTWSATLETNVGSDPTPSYYTITRHITCAGCGSLETMDIQVPAGAGPYDAEDIAVVGISVPPFFLSDELPLAIAAVADEGTCIRASRCDHVHPYTGLATDVELAVVQADIDAHEADAAGAHAATAVSNVPSGSVAATTVQAAIDEIATDYAAADTAHATDATDAHDASAVSFAPTGTIAATDVQAAIAELLSESAPSSHMTTALGDVGHHPSRIDATTLAGAGTDVLGEIRYVTDGSRGVFISRGDGFYPLRECVNVRDFGVKGDGAAVVRADVVAAFAAAVASERPLYWPEPHYLIQFGNDDLFTGTTLFSSASGADFFMYGEAHTVIEFEADASGVAPDLNFRWTAFDIQGSGRKVDVQSLTFRHMDFDGFGPLPADFNNVGGGICFKWTPTGASPEIRFARCRWEKPWNHILQRLGGDAATTDPYVEFVDCPRMDFLTGIALQGAATIATAPVRPWFVMDNCHLTGYKDQPGYNTANPVVKPSDYFAGGHGAGIYAWPDTSCLIRGTRFSGIGGSMQHQSGGGVFEPTVKKSIIYDGCVFEDSCGENLLTPVIGDVGSNFTFVIRNCEFSASGPNVRCNADILGSTFHGLSIDSGDITDCTVQVRGNSFYNPTGAVAQSIIPKGTNAVWRIIDNLFVGDWASAAIIGGNYTGLDVEVAQNRFRGLTDSAAQRAFVQPTRGRWDIHDNTYAGRVREGCVYVSQDNGITAIDLNDNDSSRIVNNRPFTATAALTANIVRGTGNRYGTGASDTPYSVAVQQLAPRPGLNPTPIASAASVTVPITHDIHHISGATAIDNLFIGTTAAEINRCFSGATVRLIPDGAWSLTAAGNIVPLSLAARTVNDVATLIYDAGQTKWLEV